MRPNQGGHLPWPLTCALNCGQLPTFTPREATAQEGGATATVEEAKKPPAVCTDSQDGKVRGGGGGEVRSNPLRKEEVLQSIHFP